MRAPAEINRAVRLVGIDCMTFNRTESISLSLQVCLPLSPDLTASVLDVSGDAEGDGLDGERVRIIGWGRINANSAGRRRVREDRI